MKMTLSADYKPVADRMPSTPEEVLTAIEDGITSLDYTLSVLNDNERRPLTADEVIEMQVMDEGVVQWRDEILDLMTNQTQVCRLCLTEATPFQESESCAGQDE